MTINYKVGMWALILAVLAGLSGGLAALFYQVNQFLPVFFHLHDFNTAQIIQTHAIMMVFYVLQPVLMVSFNVWFLPVLMGSKKFAFPSINIFSVFLLWVGFLFNFSSFFYVENALLNILSLVFWSLASLLFSINVMVTFINHRNAELKYSSVPLFAWIQFISSGFLLCVSSAFLAVLTGDFWNYNIRLDWVISQTIQNFSLPIMTVLILPAFGLIIHIIQTVSEALSHFNKVLLGFVALYSLVLFVSWNKFVINGFLWQVNFSSTIEKTLIISLYILVVVLSIFALRFFKAGNKKIPTPVLWSFGFIILLFFAWPYTGLINGVNQIHSPIIYAILMAVFAGFYFWMGKIFGKLYSEILGKLHFYVTMIGVLLTLDIIPLGKSTLYIGDLFLGLSIFIFEAVLISAYYNANKPIANYWGKKALTNEWKLPSPMFFR